LLRGRGNPASPYCNPRGNMLRRFVERILEPFVQTLITERLVLFHTNLERRGEIRRAEESGGQDLPIAGQRCP